jgi:RNA-directed DNA polymerase
MVKLVNAGDTKIQRHIKIRGEANPFDPKQETYFEDRLGLKMKNSLLGKVKWFRLWWNQDKECPICKEKITKETGWNVHHILPKSEGGKDNLSNLVMVHPNCHRQIHSQKLKVVKPVPEKGL